MKFVTVDTVGICIDQNLSFVLPKNVGGFVEVIGRDKMPYICRICGQDIDKPNADIMDLSFHLIEKHKMKPMLPSDALVHYKYP